MDLLVADRVIVELKSVEQINPIDVAQMVTYLNLSGHCVGLLIDFNVPLFERWRPWNRTRFFPSILGVLRVLGGENHAVGSSASCSPSPRKLTASTTTRIASPGKIVSHGLDAIVACASISRLPHVGVGG